MGDGGGGGHSSPSSSSSKRSRLKDRPVAIRHSRELLLSSELVLDDLGEYESTENEWIDDDDDDEGDDENDRCGEKDDAWRFRLFELEFRCSIAVVIYRESINVTIECALLQRLEE